VVYQNNIELGALWPGCFMHRPIVISVRTWIRANDGRVRPVDRLKKWVLSRADAVIAISEAIRRDSFEEAIVIGNPYRSGLFRVLPEILRQNSVAFLGRFVSDKGADLLIRAFAQVREQSSGLTLIGSGPEEQQLRRLGDEVGVQPRFTGPLEGEALVRELNRHAILVVPSRWPEPFGNVALEGMACGCVIVASDGGGLPDAIGSGGLIFERGNENHLAEQLKKILADPILRDELKLAAAAKLEHHREEAVCGLYLQKLTEAAIRRCPAIL
jgi:glycosyltransferase involved in cell wall biosynthesis